MKKLRAVVLDWAGTAVDFGCMAPVAAFQAAFRSRGVEVPIDVVRAPMGLHKRDHIRAIGRATAVAQAWLDGQGTPFGEADVEALYSSFLPLQAEHIRAHSELIPGVLELQEAVRSRGLRIGSTTGYVEELMDVLVPLAHARGYRPDFVISASEVPAGRPAPWMMFRNAEALGVYPMSCVVKIGDTPADMEEGRNAGAWTIGLARSGNEVGMPEVALAALPAAERARRLEDARYKLAHAGAHFVVDMPLDCVRVLDELDRRIEAGERP